MTIEDAAWRRVEGKLDVFQKEMRDQMANFMQLLLNQQFEVRDQERRLKALEKQRDEDEIEAREARQRQGDRVWDLIKIPLTGGMIAMSMWRP